jgi:hypothetical protein
VSARFPTTRWSRITRAGDPDDATVRAALEQLCHDYRFVRLSAAMMSRPTMLRISSRDSSLTLSNGVT